MEKNLVSDLKAIVGEENVSAGTEGAKKFLRPGQETPDLVVVKPQEDSEVQQIVRPETVMNELLGTILTVQNFVVAGAVVVGLATLATAVLVFMLSLRLRRRERVTLTKIGGSRLAVASMMASEIVFVLLGGLLLAGGLTVLTRQFGSTLIRALIRM